MTPTRPIAPAEAAQGMAHVSLFSGVGGFELAMSQAGISTIAACEIDKAARGVLADHFPDTHIYHDVKGVTGDSLRSLGADPGRTVLTAGWPCQGNSVAGRRGGMADERSGLWAEVARILAEFRPAWFIGENVPGLLSVAGGWDYATVLGDMARLGYGFAWRVLDSRRFGVPQRRRRVVLVGHLGDDGRAPAQVLLEPQGGGRNPAEGVTPRPIFARRAGGSAHFRSVSPAVTAKWAKGTGGPAGDEDQNLVIGVTGTISHALTAEGADASEDGTGRGTPIVAMAFPGQAAGDVYFGLSEHAPTLGTTQIHSVIYAAGRTTALDTAQGGPDDNAAQGGHLVAYQKVRRSGERGPDGELPPEVWAERNVAATLSPNDLTSEHRAVELIAITGDTRVLGDSFRPAPAEGNPPAKLTGGLGVTVRRLTPRLRECERLQGYPDGWTLTSNGKAQADSARYKQLGNSIAVPVFTWVAKRLAAVASSCHGTGAAA